MSVCHGAGGSSAMQNLAQRTDAWLIRDSRSRLSPQTSVGVLHALRADLGTHPVPPPVPRPSAIVACMGGGGGGDAPPLHAAALRATLRHPPAAGSSRVALALSAHALALPAIDAGARADGGDSRAQRRHRASMVAAGLPPPTSTEGLLRRGATAAGIAARRGSDVALVLRPQG
jgi:hypothetical protein